MLIFSVSGKEKSNKEVRSNTVANHMSKQNKIDTHYEKLIKLYLRLKGFISSNLIIHSEQQGDSKSELDVVGFRMPFHLQRDRQVNVTDYLECSSDRLEIIIADVKNCSKLDNVKFNKGLRTDRSSIQKLVEWIGCYDSVDDKVITKFENCLNLHRYKDYKGFAGFNENVSFGKIAVKFTFFCPSLEAWDGNGFKFIHGQEIIDFTWVCLNPKTIIETCSRIYGFKGWNELEPYVRFFKESDEKVDKIKLEEFFASLD